MGDEGYWITLGRKKYRVALIPEDSPLANLEGSAYTQAGLGNDFMTKQMLRSLFDSYGPKINP